MQNVSRIPLDGRSAMYDETKGDMAWCLDDMKQSHPIEVKEREGRLLINNNAEISQGLLWVHSRTLVCFFSEIASSLLRLPVLQVHPYRSLASTF